MIEIPASGAVIDSVNIDDTLFNDSARDST